MIRHYYIGDELNELEAVETELEARGISKPQIHFYSEADAELEKHHLHQVQDFMKKDIVHSTEVGGAVGVILAMIVLAAAYITGFAENYGWLPSIGLALLILCFSIWEGGLFGIQVRNKNFTRFEKDVHDGKHVMFVDVKPEEEPILTDLEKRHQHLKVAGLGRSTPGFVIGWQNLWNRFVHWSP